MSLSSKLLLMSKLQKKTKMERRTQRQKVFCNKNRSPKLKDIIFLTPLNWRLDLYSQKFFIRLTAALMKPLHEVKIKCSGIILFPLTHGKTELYLLKITRTLLQLIKNNVRFTTFSIPSCFFVKIWFEVRIKSKQLKPWLRIPQKYVSKIHMH